MSTPEDSAYEAPQVPSNDGDAPTPPPRKNRDGGSPDPANNSGDTKNSGNSGKDGDGSSDEEEKKENANTEENAKKADNEDENLKKEFDKARERNKSAPIRQQLSQYKDKLQDRQDKHSKKIKDAGSDEEKLMLELMNLLAELLPLLFKILAALLGGIGSACVGMARFIMYGGTNGLNFADHLEKTLQAKESFDQQLEALEEAENAVTEAENALEDIENELEAAQKADNKDDDKIAELEAKKEGLENTVQNARENVAVCEQAAIDAGNKLDAGYSQLYNDAKMNDADLGSNLKEPIKQARDETKQRLENVKEKQDLRHQKERNAISEDRVEKDNDIAAKKKEAKGLQGNEKEAAQQDIRKLEHQRASARKKEKVGHVDHDRLKADRKLKADLQRAEGLEGNAKEKAIARAHKTHNKSCDKLEKKRFKEGKKYTEKERAAGDRAVPEELRPDKGQKRIRKAEDNSKLSDERAKRFADDFESRQDNLSAKEQEAGREKRAKLDGNVDAARKSEAGVQRDVQTGKVKKEAKANEKGEKKDALSTAQRDHLDNTGEELSPKKARKTKAYKDKKARSKEDREERVRDQKAKAKGEKTGAEEYFDSRKKDRKAREKADKESYKVLSKNLAKVETLDVVMGARNAAIDQNNAKIAELRAAGKDKKADKLAKATAKLQGEQAVDAQAREELQQKSAEAQQAIEKRDAERGAARKGEELPNDLTPSGGQEAIYESPYNPSASDKGGDYISFATDNGTEKEPSYLAPVLEKKQDGYPSTDPEPAEMDDEPSIPRDAVDMDADNNKELNLGEAAEISPASPTSPDVVRDMPSGEVDSVAEDADASERLPEAPVHEARDNGATLNDRMANVTGKAEDAKEQVKLAQADSPGLNGKQTDTPNYDEKQKTAIAEKKKAEQEKKAEQDAKAKEKAQTDISAKETKSPSMKKSASRDK